MCGAGLLRSDEPIAALEIERHRVARDRRLDARRRLRTRERFGEREQGAPESLSLIGLVDRDAAQVHSAVRDIDPDDPDVCGRAHQ